MRFSSFIASFIFIATFVGCSGNPTIKYSSTQHTPIQQLNEQLSRWKGVPYQYGGLSKKGIDCSGFVYLTFRDKFGINLPRTTKEQAKAGTLIPTAHLKTGDLVFFKTGPSIRHVGIYVKNREFLHASTNQGVKKSSLDNAYWRERFWKAKRI